MTVSKTGALFDSNDLPQKESFAPMKYTLLTVLAIISSTVQAEKLIDNLRLSAMYAEDQRARTTKPIDWSKVAPMDKAHQDEALKLLSAGKVRTANDYFHAAMLFQHGNSTEDYQLAYSLARLSVALNPSNKRALWLSAASWDRILMSKDVPQWYATQYRRPSPEAPMELYKVDESAVTDEERAALNVPSLQQARAMLTEINQ
jgi:hypothetical protein